jgi:hypothetical protein
MLQYVGGWWLGYRRSEDCGFQFSCQRHGDWIGAFAPGHFYDVISLATAKFLWMLNNANAEMAGHAEAAAHNPFRRLLQGHFGLRWGRMGSA